MYIYICDIANVFGCFNNLFRLLQDFMWKFTMTESFI